MGKKSNSKGSKKGKARSKASHAKVCVTSVSWYTAPPRLTPGFPAQKTSRSLPAEVLAVVAEFLVGQHAFGTAASLNRTSHSVQDETLPVLYETLILDDPDRIKMKGKLSVGLQYTK